MTDPSGFEDLGDLAPPSRSRPSWLIPAAIAALVVAAAVVVVIIVSGGGSSSSSTSLSSYVKKANAICGELSPQINSASTAFGTAFQNGDVSSMESSGQTLVSVDRDELSRIQALAQPSQDSGLINQLYRTDSQVLNDLQSGLSSQSNSQIQQSVSLAQQANSLASQIGLNTCAGS